MITLRDNHTYKGDLNIIIPADKHLYIMAANGDRPHIRGNLSVRGIASSNQQNQPGDFTNDQPQPGELINDQTQPGELEQPQPGEFTVEGLLIQGKLTVLPGNLKRLHIIHSTLVPDGEKDVLVVEENVQPTTEPETEAEDWLMAVIMYVLNLVLRIIQLLKKMASRSPQENVQELTRLVKQQILWVLSALQEWIDFWQNPQEKDPNSSSTEQSLNPCSWLCCPESSATTIDQDNQHLSIIIHHSICGAIALSSQVPALKIVDSIIDNGISNGIDNRANANDKNDTLDNGTNVTGKLAISANGRDTSTELKTTPVFGNTVVHRLDASDCIFNGKVTARRRQVGCVRFCYLPENVHTPQRYRCQPDLALAQELNRLPGAISALAIHPENGTIFAGVAGNSIFYYSENNQNWQQLNNSPFNNKDSITSLLYTKKASQDESYLFAVTTGGEVFRYSDVGQEWEHINPDSTTTSITAIFTDTPSHLFVGTAGEGIFHFTHTGEAWTAVNLCLKKSPNYRFN